MRLVRIVALEVAPLIAAFAGAPQADARQSSRHHVIVAVNANQSSNWSGYNQGTIEQGGKLFTQVSGDWTVPTARPHVHGQDEFSSSWVGIGGGCVDADCNVTDSTLIQAGTEQDVDAAGKTSYYAWWELIPAPSLEITTLKVAPGNRMHVDIHEVVANSNVWVITVKNVSTGKSWSTTVPYSSTHATAEWIEETPLIIDTSGAGLAAMPNLGAVTFDKAYTNGKPTGLKTTEEMQLVDFNTNPPTPVATPSAPDRGHDGFRDCVWASTCRAPTGD